MDQPQGTRHPAEKRREEKRREEKRTPFRVNLI